MIKIDTRQDKDVATLTVDCACDCHVLEFSFILLVHGFQIIAG
jgi:hypothetical protein